MGPARIQPTAKFPRRSRPHYHSDSSVGTCWSIAVVESPARNNVGFSSRGTQCFLLCCNRCSRTLIDAHHSQHPTRRPPTCRAASCPLRAPPRVALAVVMGRLPWGSCNRYAPTNPSFPSPSLGIPIRPRDVAVVVAITPGSESLARGSAFFWISYEAQPPARPANISQPSTSTPLPPLLASQ